MARRIHAAPVLTGEAAREFADYIANAKPDPEKAKQAKADREFHRKMRRLDMRQLEMPLKAGSRKLVVQRVSIDAPFCLNCGIAPVFDGAYLCEPCRDAAGHRAFIRRLRTAAISQVKP